MVQKEGAREVNRNLKCYNLDVIIAVGYLFGKDYFDELLEEIREIRASERRAYQKIADVFEQCSYDYDKNSDTAKAFCAFVQNKLRFAITGKTAVELIYVCLYGLSVGLTDKMWWEYIGEWLKNSTK